MYHSRRIVLAFSVGESLVRVRRSCVTMVTEVKYFVVDL